MLGHVGPACQDASGGGDHHCRVEMLDRKTGGLFWSFREGEDGDFLHQSLPNSN